MEKTCLLFCLILTLLKQIINDENVQKKDDAVMNDYGDYDFTEAEVIWDDYFDDAELIQNCGDRSIRNRDRHTPYFNHMYDIHIRPMIKKGEPLLIEVNMLIQDIIKIDTKAQSIAMEAVTVLDWKDIRLRITEWCKEDVHGKYLVLPGDYAEQIWMPDIFIDKASQIRNPIYLNDASSLRFHENQLVSFSTLLNWNTGCEMDFTFFPFDMQVCTLKIESFDWGSEHLNVSWSENLIRNNSLLLELDMYDLEIIYKKTEYDFLDIPFNILHMELHLKRKLFYYLLNVYLPSTFLITVSYSSLYLTPTSKVPRIGMCLMTLLSVTTTINDVKNTMPRVTYITMADAWLFPIIYYSFLCLFEFFIIQYLVELEMEVTAKKVECAARVLFAIIPLLWIAVYAGIAYFLGYQANV